MFFKEIDMIVGELEGQILPEKEAMKFIENQGLEWRTTDDFEQLSYHEYYTTELYRYGCVDFMIGICHNTEDNTAEICAVEYELDI